MAIDSDDPATGELPRVSSDDTGGPPRPRRFRPFRFTLKLLAFVAVVYFAMVAIVPGARNATRQLRNVDPVLLLLGLSLEMAALLAYTLLTRAALGDEASKISRARLFRIQMSTKALSSIVPGGSAAGSAMGYRLMTLSGVDGRDAGFALATAGLGSAVVLNLLFWIGLMVSIPIRGVNPGYATAAVAGIVLMLVASAIVFGLMEGQGRAEKIVRWAARHLRLNENRTAAGLRHIGGRLEDLAADRRLLLRVLGWAAANWILDAASLWVFLRAFGASTDVDALIVAFGLVNVLAVIPIMPGGLGIIDGGLPVILVAFGLTKATALLGVATYRLAQFFFPILLGGVLYGSLRVGPWSIKRRERLQRLRDIAADASTERAFDFSVRFGPRRKPLVVDETKPIAATDDDTKAG
ncbi:MAG: putative heme transporter [Ilumatobacteraceae bacterium]|nr:putative heme transporter [Ilumatobacteraceae bacterium]